MDKPAETLTQKIDRLEYELNARDGADASQKLYEKEAAHARATTCLKFMTAQKLPLSVKDRLLTAALTHTAAPTPVTSPAPAAPAAAKSQQGPPDANLPPRERLSAFFQTAAGKPAHAPAKTDESKKTPREKLAETTVVGKRTSADADK